MLTRAFPNRPVSTGWRMGCSSLITSEPFKLDSQNYQLSLICTWKYYKVIVKRTSKLKLPWQPSFDGNIFQNLLLFYRKDFIPVFFYFIELLFYFHSFIPFLPYIQNFTVQGWNDEIKEKVRNLEAYNE